MEAGKKTEIAHILKQFRLPEGPVNYPMVMQVPLSERLPAMYDRNYLTTTALVGLAISSAFDKMRFKKELPEGLVNDIADEVLGTASEDNLSMEDLMLFLQGLVRGTYGNVEEMSVSRFMTIFEQYRQERHEVLLTHRENEHLQFKGLGDANRTKKDDPLAEHFGKMADTISGLRSSMRDLKKENNTLSQANNYFKD